MEIFGHVISFYAAMRRAGISKPEAESLLEEYTAKICLTDAIRSTVTGENVVKYGRAYSHFTDGCSIVLPYGEKLKTFTNIHQTIFKTGKDYRSKFADEPTDFGLFIRTNPQLFAPENSDWGIAVMSHLHQDVNSDILWQSELCKCNTDTNEVLYCYTGETVSGEKFRKDMSLINIYMHRVFVELVFEMFGDYIFEDFVEYAKKSFHKWYSKAMAQNTCKYLNMDSRIFSTPSRKLYNELAISETKICESCGQLESIACALFNDAMVSCNALLNKIARS